MLLRIGLLGLFLVCVCTEPLWAQDSLPAKKKKGFFGRLFSGSERSDSIRQAEKQADAKLEALPGVDTMSAKERRRLRRELRRNPNLRPSDLLAKSPTSPGADTATSASTLNRLIRPQDRQKLRNIEGDVRNSLVKRDFETAMKYLELYKAAQDSLSAALVLAEQARSKALDLQRSKVELALENELLAEEARTEEAKTYGFAAGLCMALALLGIVFLLFRDRNRTARLLSQQNHQLTELNEEIKAQRDLLEHQNVHIMDSIQYAKRIQEAILPSQANIRHMLPNSFVYYQPKDIVSGDFFWFYPTRDYTYIAAVDCTGHGVPGAFMSVLGMSLLNQIVAEHPGLAPGEILNRLHEGVIRSLQQQVGSTNQDGMDLSLCALSNDRRTLQVAGANNPLYLIRRGALAEVKVDKAPIGGARYAGYTFETHTVALEPGDTFYLFSDGYADQFGGDRGRKFTYKRLREKLQEIANRPMDTQVKVLDTEFQTWRGNHEQLDDVLLIGVRV